MKTPRKAADAAMPSVTPTMALDKPTLKSAEELDAYVAVEVDEEVVEVDEVEVVLVDVAVEDEVSDDEVEELVDVADDDDDDVVDVAVAEVDELSSVLVDVLSARATMFCLLRPCSDLLRSSPSRSASLSSPEMDPVWHFSVIHSAFSASSSVQPAASKHVARSSVSTVSIAMQRDIIGLSAHDRSATMFARHPLPISRGAAVTGLASSRARATRGRVCRMLKEFIV